MKVYITEYLQIELDGERWECRRCGHDIGPARDNYKEGLLVYDRDPREIHKPLIDPDKYAYSFAPDPHYTALLEYYCPGCGTLVETEYTVPGHPPVRDIELDIDVLRSKAVAWAAEHGGALPTPDQVEPPAPARTRHVHRH